MRGSDLLGQVGEGVLRLRAQLGRVEAEQHVGGQHDLSPRLDLRRTRGRDDGGALRDGGDVGDGRWLDVPAGDSF